MEELIKRLQSRISSYVIAKKCGDDSFADLMKKESHDILDQFMDASVKVNMGSNSNEPVSENFHAVIENGKGKFHVN